MWRWLKRQCPNIPYAQIPQLFLSFSSFPPSLFHSQTHTPPAVMMKMMMMKPNLKPNPQCMPNTLATVVHHTCKSNLQCIDDGDDDDHDGDLYIMGAVCLCVCYVFSYFNFLRWENTFEMGKPFFEMGEPFLRWENHFLRWENHF